MNNFKPLLVILPAWMVSLVGWLMVIVFFGKFDQEMYKIFPNIRTNTSYNVSIIPFWLFAFGLPLTNVALGLYAVTSNRILGVISQIFGTVCALFIGPCLYVFSTSLANSAFIIIPEGYYIAGLAGALLSMLSLVAMMAFMPFAKGFLTNTNNQFSYHVDQDTDVI